MDFEHTCMSRGNAYETQNDAYFTVRKQTLCKLSFAAHKTVMSKASLTVQTKPKFRKIEVPFE